MIYPSTREMQPMFWSHQAICNHRVTFPSTTQLQYYSVSFLLPLRFSVSFYRRGKRQKKLMHLYNTLSRFYGKSTEIISLRAPGNYSAPFWSNRCFICLLENPKTIISMISGLLNVSSAPKTIYVLSLETPRYLKKTRKCMDHFENIIC